MKTCENTFQSLVDKNANMSVLLFEHENCRGDGIEFDQEGVFVLDNLKPKSFIIPENFKVRFIKNTTDDGILSTEFNHHLWETFVYDVDEYVELWQSLRNDEIHSSFDNIYKIEIDIIGKRNHIIAHSCVGLKDEPLKKYQPIVDGKLNQTCESFLDTYCSSSDPYNIDLCSHRKTHAHVDNSTDSSSSLLISICICIAIIISLCVLLRIVFQQNNKTFQKKNLSNNHLYIHIGD